MFRKYFSLGCFVFLSGSLSAQPAQVTAGATALSRAMQSTVHARMGFEASIQWAIEHGKATGKMLECSRSDDLAFVTDAYAQAIDAGMSTKEIQVATEFFSSADGKAYLEYTRTQEMKKRGIPDPDPRELSPAQERAMLKFAETSAGKKLFGDRILETAELRANLTRGMSDLISKCSKA